MMAREKYAVLALLTVSLSGCSASHRQQQPPPPALQTGQGQLAEQQKKDHQPPPPTSLPQPAAVSTPPQLPPVKPVRVKKSKKKPSTQTTQTASAAQEPETRAIAPQINASPIGELTTGDSAAGQQNKHDTTLLISQTERGLAGLKHPLSGEQKTTAGQIRTFISQARVALANGDDDGAHTLATKAKLLLDELIKQ